MRLSTGKLLALATCGLILALVAGEMLARIVYYGVHGSRSLALSEFAENANESAPSRIVEPRKPLPTRADRERAAHALYEEAGRTLLSEFQGHFRTAFEELAEAVQVDGAKLAVAYIPAPPGREILTKSNRVFFRGLANRYSAGFLDLGDALQEHEPEHVYLLPEDEHLSRLGNQIVARELANWLPQFLPEKPRRSQASQGPYPRLGDNDPDTQKHDGRGWSLYQARINGQGLRRPSDLLYPKRGHHVLLLGDSFTYGVYLAREHTYAHMLDRRLQAAIVLNAGVCGYTITDEAALYRERATQADADVVVLQLYDNDLTDMFSYLRNRQARDRKSRRYRRSVAEEEFFGRLGAAKPR